jgi:hypothetical protein
MEKDPDPAWRGILKGSMSRRTFLIRRSLPLSVMIACLGCQAPGRPAHPEEATPPRIEAASRPAETLPEPLLLLQATSGMTHGGSGNFELPVSLEGRTTTEPKEFRRVPLRMTFVFSQPIESVDGTFEIGDEVVISVSDPARNRIIKTSISAEENKLIVEVQVGPGALLTFTLIGLRAANGGATLTGDHDVSVQLLLGELNGDGCVGVPDLKRLKEKLFAVVDHNCFIYWRRSDKST